MVAEAIEFIIKAKKSFRQRGIITIPTSIYKVNEIIEVIPDSEVIVTIEFEKEDWAADKNSNESNQVTNSDQ